MTVPNSIQTLEILMADLRGPLVMPSSDRYDEARAVYNAMIDRHPAAIAECADVSDVQTCIRFARDHDLTVAVRGGGHNAAGLGVWDDALVIDLSALNEVAVDPETRTVRVGGGCLWNEVDAATGEYGLATPSGVISTTGVGGLTLGGGIGHLSRRCGLTVDNLLAADVVLADGSLATANEQDHPDLFWALRGGGGNFGVATSFLFRCHEIGAVAAGPIFYDIEELGEVLRWYRDFLPNAPTELSGFFATLSVPSGEPFPEELWQRPVCGIFWCYTGPLDRTDEVLQVVRSFKQPLVDGIAEMPFAQFQSAFDPVYPPGFQWYWRGDFIGEITDSAVDVHEQFGGTLPTALTTMHLYPIDGVVHQVGASATAFRFRDARWANVIVGVDPDPANAGKIKDWTVSYWEALHATSLGGGYVNFMMDEGADRVRASYGENYEKLARIKAKYDPGNVFHINQNIPPSK